MMKVKYALLWFCLVCVGLTVASCEGCDDDYDYEPPYMLVTAPEEASGIVGQQVPITYNIQKYGGGSPSWYSSFHKLVFEFTSNDPAIVLDPTGEGTNATLSLGSGEESDLEESSWSDSNVENFNGELEAGSTSYTTDVIAYYLCVSVGETEVQGDVIALSGEEVNRFAARGNDTTNVTCEAEPETDDGVPQISWTPDSLEDWINSISTMLATWMTGYNDIANFGVERAEVTEEDAEQNGDFVSTNPNARMLRAGDAELLTAGEYLIGQIQLDEDVDQGHEDHRLQYAVVLDSDGVAANNWLFQDPYDWDFYQGADRWYQLTYSLTTEAWAFQCLQVDESQDLDICDTDALAMIFGDTITFFIPDAEIPDPDATYRVTAYGDDGNYAEDDRGGDVNGANPAEALRAVQ